jgi:hypothetical protein
VQSGFLLITQCLAMALLTNASAQALGGGIGESVSPWETNADALCSSLTTRSDQDEPVASAPIEECEAEAAARLERRRAAAPSLRREELAIIPDEFLIAEERQRIADLAAQEIRAARIEREARRRDRQWMRPALSAAYCTYVQMRADALARLGSPRKRSRLPPDEKIEITRRASDYQRSMKTIAIALRAWATTPTACDDALTMQIQSCMAPENSRRGCSAEVLRYVELAPMVFP